jgi:hypothetical protein
VTAKFVKLTALAAVVAVSTLSASCGEFNRSQGNSPALIVVDSLLAASGATPAAFGGTLQSDVQRLVRSPAPCSDASPCATIHNDLGQVVMRLISKDPGVPGIAQNPSILNTITINRYHVDFTRTDGRSVPGVDLPYAFDSAVTFTIPSDGQATAIFQLIRHTAKEEAPLRALAFNGDIISTIATVTFYGRDQAGNEVIATARIGVDFGDFADPS